MQNPLIFELIKSHENDAAMAHLAQHSHEVNLKGWYYTPLHKAAEWGNEVMVRYLIAQGAQVNARRVGTFTTPLCWAQTRAIAVLLLEAGATMHDLELNKATRDDRVEVIDELLSQGALINPEEPEYLLCHSIAAINVYRKYGVALTGADTTGSTILHRLAWANQPEVFDHAMASGARWAKDSSMRTPYVSALQGGRTEMVNHLRSQYPELTSHRVSPIDSPETLAFEPILFCVEHPTVEHEFLALTNTAKLVRYRIIGGQPIAVQAVEIDVSTIRNFTVGPDQQLIVPTADHTVLRLDLSTLEVIDSIAVEAARFNQITYLNSQQSYFASDGWNGYLLDADFQVLDQYELEDGLFYPLFNQNETLMAAHSYDQETFHDLYTLSGRELTYVDTFFNARNDCSRSFAFHPSGDRFAVAYPNELLFGRFEHGEIAPVLSLDLTPFPSAYGLSAVAFADAKTLLLAKGKQLAVLSAASGKTLHAQNLEIEHEVRGMQVSRSGDVLLLWTQSEVLSLSLAGVLGRRR